MSDTTDFDLNTAHRFFAADCFNRAWDLMEKRHRTPEDGRLLVALTHASIYHWLQRPDCKSRNLSIGYWQASRAQALLGNAAEAKRLGEVCLSFSTGLAPFLVGYAHEALARAALVAGDLAALEAHTRLALDAVARIEEADDRALLLADVRMLSGNGSPA